MWLDSDQYALPPDVKKKRYCARGEHGPLSRSYKLNGEVLCTNHYWQARRVHENGEVRWDGTRTDLISAVPSTDQRDRLGSILAEVVEIRGWRGLLGPGNVAPSVPDENVGLQPQRDEEST